MAPSPGGVPSGSIGHRHAHQEAALSPPSEASEVTQPRLRTTRSFLVLAGLAIFLTSINLRPAVTSAGSLLRDVQDATGMSGTVAGLLTSLPPVCFGVFGLLAGRLGRRFATAHMMIAAMAVLTVSLVARAATDASWAFVLLTVPALAGMGFGNVLLPVAVKRWFPARVGRMTGLYSLGLALGTAGAAAVSVPIASAFGSWRFGLAAWALPALLAAVPWFWLRRGSAGAGTSGAAGGVDDFDVNGVTGPRPASVHRDLRSWALAGFFGMQSLAAYTVMGWLPSIFQDAGLTPTAAGGMLAITMGVGAPISVLLPELAARRHDQRAWPIGLAVCAATAYVGLLVAPAAVPALWATLLGVGMGAFPLALVLIGLRAWSSEGTAKLSSLTQGVGYFIAATGPVAIGVLRDATQSWTPPLLVLTGLLVPQLLCGLVAGRAGHVDVHADDQQVPVHRPRQRRRRRPR